VGAEPAGCNDWTLSVALTQRECFAAGILRYVALTNLQGAAQFCKWRAANPGEWSRLRAYAEAPSTKPAITTWFGVGLRDVLEAYSVLGAPPFTIVPNTAPNRCRTPTLAAPVVAGVTADASTATVTIAP
jgi:hypothetical protein